MPWDEIMSIAHVMSSRTERGMLLGEGGKKLWGFFIHLHFMARGAGRKLEYKNGVRGKMVRE